MHPQLEGIREEFELARQKLRQLVATTPAARWTVRPAEGSWSAAECVAHLNLTSTEYVQILEDGLRQAREVGGKAPDRFRKDLLGWLLWRGSGPRGKMRMKTTPRFVPGAARPIEDLIQEFERLQDQQIRLVSEADRLPINRVKIASPFNEKIHYSLYSAFTILPAHQHRHLIQAERALSTTVS